MRSVVFRGERYPLPGNPGGIWKGFAYTCPTCAAQWCRVELSTGGLYHLVSWPCVEHGSPSLAGGNPLPALEWWGWENHLPRSKREILDLLPPGLVLALALAKADHEISLTLKGKA